MEELHEATRQYLSCDDPTEAAARRQRVMIGDAKGEMEKAAASILAANTTHRQNIIISPILQQPGNNSQNPPVRNLLPGPESNFIPAEETQINTSNDAPRNEDNQLRRLGRQRIKPEAQISNSEPENTTWSKLQEEKVHGGSKVTSQKRIIPGQLSAAHKQGITRNFSRSWTVKPTSTTKS